MDKGRNGLAKKMGNVPIEETTWTKTQRVGTSTVCEVPL